VRLSGERGVWLPFHLIAVPFWIAAFLGGALLLHLL